MRKNENRKGFIHFIFYIFISIILLFAGYILTINYLKQVILDERKGQLKKMVHSAHGVIVTYHNKVAQGLLTEEEAQKIVIETISALKYGEDKKEYYWLIDYDNTMLSHPFFIDSMSHSVVNENFWHTMTNIATLARTKDEGFISYQWQWKDDTNKVENKISYVKNFAPWQWVIGTGFYENEVNPQINQITKFIVWLLAFSFTLISVMYFFAIRNAYRAVKKMRKQEEDLKYSDQQFKNIAENINSGLIVLNLDKEKIVYSNNQILEIFDIQDKKETHFNLSRYAVMEEKQIVEQQFKTILSKKQKTEFGFWINTPKGNKKFIHNSISFDSDKQNSTAYLLTSDNTLDKSNRDHIDILLQTINQSPDSIGITDLNGNIDYVNTNFINKTGYNREELIGNNPRILKSGKMHPSVYTDLWHTISSGKTWEGELLNKRKNGEVLWENTIIFPIRDNRNQIIRYAAIKTDISNKRKLEQEIKQSREQVHASEKIKTALLNNISHEVNTPLNAIRGFSNLIMEDMRNEGKDISKIETVCNSTEYLINLFNNILEYSIIESGDIVIKREDIKLKDTLLSLLGKYEFRLKSDSKKKNISLKLDVPSEFEEAVVVCDRKWLTKIFDELISNAIKFTQEGDIVISYKITYESIIFSVKDSGAGIPQDEQDTIFKLFTHGANVFVSLHKGTGIGLNIIKLLVEQLGGNLWFDSKINLGTEFRFSLPSIDVKHYTLDELQHEELPFTNMFANKTIVIAEDNDYSFSYIKSKIENDIPNIVRVKSSSELLNYLDINPQADLLLVDKYIAYPTSNNLFRTIRSTFKNIPIISMNYDLNSKEDTSDEYYNEVLNKPFSRFELIDVLVKYLI